MNSKHSPFGHSLEAFSPDKAAQLPADIPHLHSSPASVLLDMPCSCGCCGHEQKASSHAHGGRIPWVKLAAGFFKQLYCALCKILVQITNYRYLYVGHF